jgi:hypothetical protein
VILVRCSVESFAPAAGLADLGLRFGVGSALCFCVDVAAVVLTAFTPFGVHVVVPAFAAIGLRIAVAALASLGLMLLSRPSAFFWVSFPEFTLLDFSPGVLSSRLLLACFR